MLHLPTAAKALLYKSNSSCICFTVHCKNNQAQNVHIQQPTLPSHSNRHYRHTATDITVTQQQTLPSHSNRHYRHNHEKLWNWLFSWRPVKFQMYCVLNGLWQFACWLADYVYSSFWSTAYLIFVHHLC